MSVQHRQERPGITDREKSLANMRAELERAGLLDVAMTDDHTITPTRPDGLPHVSLAAMRASMERELRKAGAEHRA